jgi:outer membrane protein assembly factor BamB
MNKIAGLAIAFLVSAAPAWGQYWNQLHTRPGLPPANALDRLNLKLAWSAYVPTNGPRDGLFSVQVFDDQILVQTRSGSVTVIRTDDGSIQWSVQVGVPYRVTHPVARNVDSVFVYNGTHLFALRRDNGAHQWTFNMSDAPSAPPVAEKDRIYVSLSGGKFLVYRLPELPKTAPAFKGTGVPGTLAQAPASPADFIAGSMGFSPPPITGEQWSSRGPQPELLWEYHADTRLEQPPLLARDEILLAGYDGTFFCTSKDLRHILYRFKANAPLAAPLGQYDDLAYVASTEYDVYALQMLIGKVTWHYVSGTPILRKPEVNDEDVFIAPQRPNLARVNRDTGERIWTNQKADRFLAANKKFVYAADPNGRLLILDKRYGTVLSTYDTRDFVVPVSNELTDRIYLASNHGLLICLYDKDYPKPLVMKHQKGPEAPGPKPKPAKPAEVTKEKGEEMEKEK